MESEVLGTSWLEKDMTSYHEHFLQLKITSYQYFFLGEGPFVPILKYMGPQLCGVGVGLFINIVYDRKAHSG